jgi:hypothetical protein
MEKIKIKANKLSVISNNFSELYNEGIVVVEQPPARRIVTLDLRRQCYDLSLSESFQGSFFLSFPLIYFRLHYRRHTDGCFSCTNLCVVAANNNVNKAFALPLPNIYYGGTVCICLGIGKHKSLDALSKDAIKNFWSSEFNGEVDDNLRIYQRSLLGNYNRWQDKTKKFPNWVPTSRNLRLEEDFSKSSFYGEAYSLSHANFLG